ncbi:MAG: hypothetical protein M1834_004750 [Cirrosporium novae-zelandiae]|nr:MAG: hypothetical protein M1834_004750 [Cirrosporium novae-zelandiae]
MTDQTATNKGYVPTTAAGKPQPQSGAAWTNGRTTTMDARPGGPGTGGTTNIGSPPTTTRSTLPNKFIRNIQVNPQILIPEPQPRTKGSGDDDNQDVLDPVSQVRLPTLHAESRVVS